MTLRNKPGPQANPMQESLDCENVGQKGGVCDQHFYHVLHREDLLDIRNVRLEKWKLTDSHGEY